MFGQKSAFFSNKDGQFVSAVTNAAPDGNNIFLNLQSIDEGIKQSRRVRWQTVGENSINMEASLARRPALHPSEAALLQSSVVTD